MKEPTSKRSKTQVWSNVVTIVLVEARNLVARDSCDDVIKTDPYVKFKLGAEKYKSKVRIVRIHVSVYSVLFTYSNILQSCWDLV